jgi:cytochrome c556
MTRKLAFVAALALATAGVARAQSLDVIEIRQTGMDLVSGDFAGIRAVVAAKGDVKTLENPSKAISRYLRLHPTLFPKGSEQGHNTKALPAIWSDTAGFEKVAGETADAAMKMAEFAKAGDADGVAAQVKVVGDGCSACHRTYRAR